LLRQFLTPANCEQFAEVRGQGRMVIKMVVNSSDITPKWNDIRTEFGYKPLYEIGGVGLTRKDGDRLDKFISQRNIRR